MAIFADLKMNKNPPIYTRGNKRRFNVTGGVLICSKLSLIADFPHKLFFRLLRCEPRPFILGTPVHVHLVNITALWPIKVTFI